MQDNVPSPNRHFIAYLRLKKADSVYLKVITASIYAGSFLYKETGAMTVGGTEWDDGPTSEMQSQQPELSLQETLPLEQGSGTYGSFGDSIWLPDNFELRKKKNLRPPPCTFLYRARLQQM